jgi:hypothetical protein
MKALTKRAFLHKSYAVVDRAVGYTPEQAQKVVRVSNIGKLSLGLQQPVDRLSLQTRRMTDDDRGAAVAAGGRPGSVLCGAKLVRQEKEIRR